MAKSRSSAGKKYLKILGTITLVLAIIGIISGIMMFVFRDKIDLSSLGNFDGIGDSLSDNEIKNILFGATIMSSVIDCLIGWLLIRAARNPEKSVLVLVLTVLGTISSAYALFSQGGGTASAVNIINLAVYVLALMAILSVRRELE